MTRTLSPLFLLLPATYVAERPTASDRERALVASVYRHQHATGTAAHLHSDLISMYALDGLIIPRFRGHPRRREDARGVFDVEEEEKDVHA